MTQRARASDEATPQWWSFADRATGLIVGSAVHCVRREADLVCPLGARVVRGKGDPREHRYDTRRRALVRHKPEAPAGDALTAWEWDEPTWRWRSVPTFEALRRRAAGDVQAQIAAAEAGQPRAVRDVAAALAGGGQPPAAALERLAAIESRVEPLRRRLQAISAARTPDELAAAGAIA